MRETIEGLIEEPADAEPSILEHERILLSNILRLRDLTAEDVMVPRADITAVEAETTLQDVLGVLSVRAHSRLPVYRESLDNVLGMLHIKDLIPRLADISKD
ncbi:MAG: CBS domain-containing protein, partial [Pseudomonadota bacterium]